MGKYRTLGTFFDRIFRNDLNSNFNDIDTDIKAAKIDFDSKVSEQKKRVDDLIVANPQPSEVQDARGGFAVLRDRLNNTDVQLAERVHKLEKANALNPLFIQTYDGYNQAVHPKVLYFANRWNGWSYWMAYTPYPGSLDFYENPCIAVSNDGVRWYTPTGLTNPLAELTTEEDAAGGHFSDTHLVYRSDTNVMECWYRYNINNAEEKIMRRTTTDGVTWTNEQILLSNTATQLYLSPTVIFEDMKYKLWFVDGSIKYMESSDGLNWSSPILCTYSLPSGHSPWHLDIVHTDLGYEMLLNTSRGGTNDKVLLTSVSSDGKTWGTFKDSIYPSKNKRAFDSQQIYRSTFVKINGKYYVYYSALAAYATFWHIALTSGDSLDSLVGGYTHQEDDKMNTSINQNVIMRPNTEINIGNYGNKYTEKKVKLVNPGVTSAELQVNDMTNTMDVKASNGTDNGYMRMVGIQFDGTLPVPANIKDGMIRWFESDKCLKYYNKTTGQWYRVQTSEYNTSVLRPTTGLSVGQMFFDFTLNKPIWRNKTNDGWVDAMGNPI